MLVSLVNIFFPYLNVSTRILNTFLVLSMGLYCVCLLYTSRCV